MRLFLLTAFGVILSTGGNLQAAEPDRSTQQCLRKVLSGFPETVSANLNPKNAVGTEEYAYYRNPAPWVVTFVGPIHYVMRQKNGSTRLLKLYVTYGSGNAYKLLGYDPPNLSAKIFWANVAAMKTSCHIELAPTHGPIQ